MSSVLPYVAVALVCGVVSGGAVLYFALRYSPSTEATSATADAAYTEVSTQSAGQTAAPHPLPPAHTEQAQEPKSGPYPVMATNGSAPAANPGPSFFSSVDEAAAGQRMAAAAPPQVEPSPAPIPSIEMRQEPKPAEDGSAPSAGSSSTQYAKLAADQEDKMLKRGSVMLQQNDIAGARLIFQYLTNHGSARGAFALAESYDPKRWAGRNVAGMAPDAKLARGFYKRAAELGSKEAAVILRKDQP